PFSMLVLSLHPPWRRPFRPQELPGLMNVVKNGATMRTARMAVLILLAAVGLASSASGAPIVIDKAPNVEDSWGPLDAVGGGGFTVLANSFVFPGSTGSYTGLLGAYMGNFGCPTEPF